MLPAFAGDCDTTGGSRQSIRPTTTNNLCTYLVQVGEEVRVIPAKEVGPGDVIPVRYRPVEEPVLLRGSNRSLDGETGPAKNDIANVEDQSEYFVVHTDPALVTWHVHNHFLATSIIC